ncbi:hypothetical protein BJY04DRAFT_1618 [Aspergillus karnatakaensis]|uniref:uncharacterized protein n=1 Tax=Aspergillus karnatakaensis TaxID=1810916 RepID=UPI003CCDBB9D
MDKVNYHIEIQFSDGIGWLARFRQPNVSLPADLVTYQMRSEIATLQFMSKTNIPVPKVLDYYLGQGHPIGAPYILVEKLWGQPLQNWHLLPSPQKRKVMHQLADIHINLQKFPFDRVGSLDSPNTDHVKPLVRACLTEFQQSRMGRLGPYSSTRDYLLAKLQITLDEIRRARRYDRQAIDTYLVSRFLHRIALNRMEEVFGRNHGDGQFYLRYHSQQMLVDDEYQITGLMGWDWTQTDTASAAFNSPRMLLPATEFYAGTTELGADELEFAQILEDKGRGDLAAIAWQGRIIHWFEYCCEFDFTSPNWQGFYGPFGALLRVLNCVNTWHGWRGVALRVYQNDGYLRQAKIRRRTQRL